MDTQITLQAGLGRLVAEDGNLLLFEDGSTLVSEDYSIGYFVTMRDKWEPTLMNPVSVRYRLDGTVDASFGEYSGMEWSGQVVARAVDTASHSGIEVLRGILQTKGPIQFADHFGNEHTVIAVGPFREKYFTQKWDDANNRVFVDIRLIQE